MSQVMQIEWSPSPDSSYASSASGTQSGSAGSTSPPRCEISLLERLIRTHPLWFLPSLQRAGALHFLQGREVGNFIVRNSREPNTMAVSVKLPGNQVEHYLVKATESNQIGLKDSAHSFPTVHQLIAHYCAHSDEIPVCLKVPSPIAEASTRQQLRSLALLGQEFWTISNPSPPCPTVAKEQSSPSDGDSQSHHLASKSSGIGSQSSSSQNSLTDLGKKPCRPTTLELGKSRTLLSSMNCNQTVTPLSVPIIPHTHRWFTPTTTLSQPSSIQSTPSEAQGLGNEKGIGFAVRSSAHSNNHHTKRKKSLFCKSIHYKDTEIVDLFKGKETILNDKVSDYEDVWSPHSSVPTNPHTPNTPSVSRGMFTFKPDIIPNTPTCSTTTPDFQYYVGSTVAHKLINQSKSPSGMATPTPDGGATGAEMLDSLHPPHTNGTKSRRLSAMSNRLSLRNVDVNLNLSADHDQENENMLKMSHQNVTPTNHVPKGLYSEPLDSINLNLRNRNLKQGSYEQRQQRSCIVINNRWSQPVLSLHNGYKQFNKQRKFGNSNSKSGKYCSTSKSSDQLHSLGRIDQGMEMEVINERTSRLPSSSSTSSSWQVDDSWQFCSNKKTENNQPAMIKDKQQQLKRNLNNLTLKLEKSFGKSSCNVGLSPLSPSPENWDHLLQIVAESSKQLESLELRESEETVTNDHRTTCTEAHESIRNIVQYLADKKENGVFGPTLKSFISCTHSGKLQEPFKVLRNIRQFVSGMKNYLVGVSLESDLIHQEVKRQSEKLSSSEFLNVDLVLEEILIDLVVKPLYSFVMKLLSREGQTTMKLENGTTNNNTKFSEIYKKFEVSMSPMQKLDAWNEFVCEVQELNSQRAEPFFSLLTTILGQVCSVDIESHVDFTVGLLPPCISERNGYSLSLLQSVVSALRTGSSGRQGGHPQPKSKVMMKEVTCVEVIVPDERIGTLIRKVVPVRETTTANEVTKILSSKLGITNTADYVLVNIRGGEENICHDNNLIRDFIANSTQALAYRRIDAKIGWPKQIS